MTPPDAKGQGSDAATPDQRPAVSFLTLAKRADFLRAASARRQGTTGFLLQARAREDDAAQVRVGYTASKKIGNAVLRNRAKRRLRALARQVMPTLAQPGWDYVLVARPDATVSRPFADLVADLTGAMRAVHRTRP
jgi:ribonuclease P protein component